MVVKTTTVKTMYVTRDAAQNSESEYRTAHAEWGFVVGKSSPCAMYHKARGIRSVVHGDDFTALGKDNDLDLYRALVNTCFEA